MIGKWYSTMSTGILELDCQHQNLDSVLSFALSSDNEQTLKLLQTFAIALSAHFKFEEQFTLPNGFPFVDSDHEAEHRTLETVVSDGIEKVKVADDNIDIVAMEFSRALMAHATNFDIPASRRADQ